MRPYILTIPEGPIFKAGSLIVYLCKALTPGSYSLRWTEYCQNGDSEQVVRYSTSSIYFVINSTPNRCSTVVGCTAWDSAGTTAEDRHFRQITGQLLLFPHNNYNYYL